MSAAAAAAALAAVSALEKKACELSDKGHFARAAEKLGAALVAAQALSLTDCLVTAWLQISQCEVLAHEVFSPLRRVLSVDERVATLDKFEELLYSAISTLQRRRAAGTLLPGALHPLEEAFNATRLKLWIESAVGSVPSTAAPLFGVETYLYAGAVTSDFVKLLRENGASLQLARFVATAADVMVQRPPVAHCEGPLHFELIFVDNLRRAVDNLSLLNDSYVAGIREVLSDAWRTLRCGAVQRVRTAEAELGDIENSRKERRAKLKADSDAAVLHGCALEACAAQEAHPKHFKRCGACRTVCYCCREHQVKDWPSHKAACKAARKAAAEEGGGAGPHDDT